MAKITIMIVKNTQDYKPTLLIILPMCRVNIKLTNNLANSLGEQLIHSTLVDTAEYRMTFEVE